MLYKQMCLLHKIVSFSYSLIHSLLTTKLSPPTQDSRCRDNPTSFHEVETRPHITNNVVVIHFLAVTRTTELETCGDVRLTTQQHMKVASMDVDHLSQITRQTVLQLQLTRVSKRMRKRLYNTEVAVFLSNRKGKKKVIFPSISHRH